MTNEKRIGVENTHTQTKLHYNYVDDKKKYNSRFEI